MQYVGIDYAKLRSHLTVMTPEGRVMKRGSVANTLEALATFMDALPPDQRAVIIEACRNWTVIHGLVEPYAQAITLAHPLKVKAIAPARIKTDAIDSRTLTDLLRADLIPAARAAYHAFKDVFTQAGRAWMQAVALPETERGLLTRYLMVEQTLAEPLATTTTEVTAGVAEDRAMQWVDSIPGIGAVPAALIGVEIDGIARFGGAGQLASYAGLVPSTHRSGTVTRHGPITKQGNRWWRWALIEAVWPASRTNAALRRFYERLKARRGAHPAKVATARKLCALVFQVLTRQTPFEVTRRVVHAT